MMKTNIMILNVLNYSKEDKEGTRLVYVLTDKSNFVDNSRFRGYTEINSFYDSKDVFDKITNDVIGKTVEATFGTKQDYKNPLKTTSVLESITYNGHTILLVQPKN